MPPTRTIFSNLPLGVRIDLPIEELRLRPLPSRSADEIARLLELLRPHEKKAGTERRRTA
jgi:hypothetical protein